MELWTERVRVARRLARAEEELKRAYNDRDRSPAARTRWLEARDEHALASAEARLLLTLLSRPQDAGAVTVCAG